MERHPENEPLRRELRTIQAEIAGLRTELGISEDTLRDAIRRRRGADTRPTRRKLSEAELNQLIDGISRGTQTA